MPQIQSFPLKIVDALQLEAPYRAALRPGEVLHDEQGRARRLPRFFYEVGSWKAAKETELAPSFGLYEFIHTDVREADVLRGFPRYVPCALTLLASALVAFRQKVGTYVFVAANGGYRSPGHALSHHASPHHWGTAVNIYRVGDDFLDNQETIERYAALAREVMPWVWVRPYGHAPGFANDHLHLDLGYATLVPHEAPGEDVASGNDNENTE